MSNDKNIPEIAVEPVGPPADANIGKVLKQTYELVAKVGEGGMGDVYKALQHPLEREVAVKILKPTDGNPEGEHYFMREVQAINMLRHPNIITIVDFGKEPDGTLYLVMEFLPGKTLKRAIRKEHPLSPHRICNICIQILNALEAAHKAGIVHCDLKPANIMLEDVAGQEDFVKVLDFGIAKVKGPAMEAGPYTQQGNIVGTFDYMSPEQIMRKDLDGRSDIWSMGVIMYEMLTRKRVFHDRDAVSIIGRVMQMPIESPIEVLGQGVIPPELNSIVMRSMQRNLDKRFQSAAEMAQALKRLMLSLEAGTWEAGSGLLPLPGDDTGSHSGSLAQSGGLGKSGPKSGPSLNSGGVSLLGNTGMVGGRTGVSSILSRSGSFGGASGNTAESQRLVTGLASGTSVLDQTFSMDALQDSLMGERRKVAVLAIQQRSKRRAGMDAEEIARRSSQEANIIKEIIGHYDGEVDSFLGGTYTVLFGARKTRVGDNLRAVQCAWALAERFRLLEQGYDHLGIGLAYGEIYIASRKGGNAFGETIDRAVEIARSSTEARVMADEGLMALTRQQVQYDAARNVGGEQVCEVLGVSDDAQASDGPGPDLDAAGVYIPRPMYFDELTRRASTIKDNQGGGIALVGPAGVGKSVLMERFVKDRQDAGWQTFLVREQDMVRGQQLAPVRAWIRLIAQTYKDPAVLLRKACESIGLQKNIENVVALYLDTRGQAAQGEMPWSDQNGFTYFTAALFHRMVRFAMKKGSVLLAADLLDTKDMVCNELLSSFISQANKFPILVMVNVRTEPGDLRHTLLPEHMEMLQVEGFTPQESRQYIAQLLGTMPQPEAIAQLHDRSSGNPLFLKEILRALVKRAGGVQALNAESILAAGIPLNLQELLAQRVDELNDNARQLLAIASVLGESFREEFFYQITPAHLGPQLAIKEFVALGYMDAFQDALGGVFVGFNPRALRLVLYDRIPKETRRQIHSTVIQFLEHAADVAAVDMLELPLMLAFHYRSVEGWEGAAHYLGKAGETLLELYDYAGAISQFREAISLIETRLPAAHPLKIGLKIRLLTSLRESGQIEAAQQLLLTIPPIEEIPAEHQANLLLETGSSAMEGGNLDRATTSLFKAVELAREQSDAKLEVKALLALAQLFEKEEQIQRAANVLVEVSKKVEAIGELDFQDPDDRRLFWTAYNQLGTLCIRQKNIPGAQQYLQAALQRAQQIQDHRGLVRIMSNLGALFLSIRDANNARDLFDRALKIARATGDLLNQARILTNLGIANLEANDLEQSKTFFKEARTIAEEIGWYEGLADLAIHIKRLRRALDGV
jgi:serine/threonine protein kinase/tetratricopeptide (TPR) repeat protein